MVDSDNCKNNVLVVLGMHRSGTSAITGLLTEMGFTPGRPRHLLKADHGNERGYYEDESVVQCNEKLLVEDSLKNLSNLTLVPCFSDINTLDGLGWIFGAWGVEFLSLQCNNLESQLIKNTIKELKNEDNRESPLVLKDPRLSLTLPKWIPHLKVVGAVIMVRNPVDVAHSLYFRNEMMPGLAYDLWLKYTLSAIKSCKEADLPYVLINYDNLIDAQHNTFELLSSFLRKISFQKNTRKLTRGTSTFINRNLRRSDKHRLFNSPNHINELFIKLISGDVVNFINEGMNCWKINGGWDSGLIFASLKQKFASNDQKVNELGAVVDRLNKHIIAGTVIRLIRFIKRDPSFGHSTKS